MANDYSRRWFSSFLDTIPHEWTDADVAGVVERLPQPEYRTILDVCCGPGRLARPLADAGYQVTGFDRDREVVMGAREAIPNATFLTMDQRDVLLLGRTFDAAVILWQSFGYFDTATNDHVLADLARCLRPGGRLLLDVYHPGHVRANVGTSTAVRAPGCRSITNAVEGDRLVSTIEYEDDSTEVMDFELIEPEELARRAEAVGWQLVESCCWWDRRRPPSPSEPRYQLVLEDQLP